MNNSIKEYLPALILMFLATFIDGLDVSIVSVSLPTMARDFNISLSQSSWIIFAYTLGLAALLLPMGKYAKNNRIKKFMIAGTVVFGISSFICGISTEFWVLIAFRLIQGIQAAMMSAVIPSMIVHMLPVDRKGLGMSVLGVASSISFILGPMLGGVIVDVLTWGWLFFVNVPVCVIIVIMAIKYIPADKPSDPSKDPTPLGGFSAILVIGQFLVMLEDFGDPNLNAIGKIISVCITIPQLVLLTWSIKHDTKEAIISPQALRNKEFLLVSTAFFLCTIVVSGASYILPYVLQGYWDMSAFESGIYLSVVSVAMAIVVLPVGKICDKYGCKWPSAAAPIFRGSFCGLMIYATINNSNPLFLLIPMITFGMSHAFSGTAQPTRMVHHSTPGYEAESTNFMLVINYVQAALGCAVFAMIFGMYAPGDLTTLTNQDLSAGFIPTMWFSIILLAVALVCTLSVKNKIVKSED